MNKQRKIIQPAKPTSLPDVPAPPPTRPTKTFGEFNTHMRHLKMFKSLSDVSEHFQAGSAMTVSKDKNGHVVTLSLVARDADAFILHALFNADSETQMRWLSELNIDVPEELIHERNTNT